ncbi:hypothetical protein SCHPADRAFT_899478 [Schizopora paradoxa]|uniref:YMC020W-like alpha/beta hydrolase domain-containing protein n=1 Tax=Schizopora paradoxa TaxID=27342 RepID=A0A0H2SAE8_9AGAM|nr:hypothetical protein SCHPADRAFT_899478 [Schizopora paradoxa]
MSKRRQANSPLWRSTLPLSRKSSQAPSISVVFAEPEQSTPASGSAAQRLAPRMPRSLKRDRDDATSIAESTDTRTEYNEQDKCSELIPERSDEGAESGKRQRIGHEDGVPSALRNESLASREPVGRKSSWFSFKSRNSSRQWPADTEDPGRDGVTTTTDAAPTSGRPSLERAISSPDADEVVSANKPIEEDTAMKSSPVNDLQQQDAVEPLPPVESPTTTSISNTPSKRRSIWFTPQTPPPLPQLQHTPSMPLSIDEDPSRPSTPESSPPAPPLPTVTSTHSSEPKLSSLNPSTSRFTLSVPLLGRSKVPIDKVAEQSKLATEVETATSIVEDTPAQASSDTQDANAAFPPVPEKTSAASIHSVPVKKSISWWDYVGLGDSGETPQSLQLGNTDVDQDVDMSHAGEEHKLAAQEDVGDNVPSTPEPEMKSEDLPGPSASQQEHTDTDVSAMAWYSPWGWTSAFRPGATSTSTSDEPHTSKTDAELVKEEALSRLEGHEEASPATDAAAVAVSPPPELANPIATSAAWNSAGWASFFSASRLLTTKTITAQGERDENGMEVMDIDEDEERATTASASNAKAPKSSPPEEPPSTRTGDKRSKSPMTEPQAPLTTSNNAKRKVVGDVRTASPTPSNKSKKSVPPTPRPPNLVLPTFKDTFHNLPRSRPRPQENNSTSASLTSTLAGFVSSVFYGSTKGSETVRSSKGKEKADPDHLEHFGHELPRDWTYITEGSQENLFLKDCSRVVVIGVHGWFPGLAMRTMLGEPTGTSSKFANMMAAAVEEFGRKHGHDFESITKIPLEGEGKISHRVQKLYDNLTNNSEWVSALREADVIFVATHSQGSIVSTHLISRLISDGLIQTSAVSSALSAVADAATSISSSLVSGVVSSSAANPSRSKPQRVCCLALCGIHLGPFAYLQKSSLVMPYIQYFESEAAAELFEFQDTDSQVSKEYVDAVKHVTNHRVKLVYIASLNDQVVPVYSGSFASASHPLILRALYIDGDAYHSSDFLSNLLVLLLRIRNANLPDGGLLAHLSEATAGSLSGVGHSTAYEELATFTLAAEYLFLADEGSGDFHDVHFEPFNARSALNDYEIPWALRELIADERVVYLFSKEFSELRDQFDDWTPRTTILRDLKRKLEPIRRLKLPSKL